MEDSSATRGSSNALNTIPDDTRHGAVHGDASSNDRQLRRYIETVDRCLQQFDAVDEWAGVISFLAKLLRILQQFSHIKDIPMKLTMSKRLAQCLNPALPAGVHQKTVEVYEQIFKNYDNSPLLAQDLQLWSYGLFPHMQNASMTNKPALLNLYDKYFFVLGQKLQPATKGMILALLPNLDEDGNEFFEITINMIYKLMQCVGHSYFSTCMWLAIVEMPSHRFAAMNYLIRKMPKIRSEEDVVFILGGDKNLLLRALCVSLSDQNVLVQRCALELLLTHFPMIDGIFSGNDLYELCITTLSVVLKKDMSLNRRLFTWVMGSDQTEFNSSSRTVVTESFRYAFERLISHLEGDDDPINDERRLLDLFRIITSLQDKEEVGPVVVDDVLMIAIHCLVKLRTIRPELSSGLTTGLQQLTSSLQPYTLFGRFCNSIMYPEKYQLDKNIDDVYALMRFALENVNFTSDDVDIIHLPFLTYCLCVKLRTVLDSIVNDDDHSMLDLISSITVLINTLLSRTSPRAFAFDVQFGKVFMKGEDLSVRRSSSVEEIIKYERKGSSTSDSANEEITNWTLRQHIEWFYTLPEDQLASIYTLPQMKIVVGRPVAVIIIDVLLGTYTRLLKVGAQPTPSQKATYYSKFIAQIIENMGDIMLHLFTAVDGGDAVRRRRSKKRHPMPVERKENDTQQFKKLQGIKLEFSSRPEFVVWVDSLVQSCIVAPNIVLRLEVASQFLTFRDNAIILDSNITDFEDFLIKFFSTLWEAIDPMRPVFHSWIVEIIWSACRTFGSHHLEEWVCGMLSNLPEDERSKVFSQFGIFWKTSEEAGNDVSVEFSRLLFQVLSCIDCGSLTLERLSRNWARHNVKSLIPVAVPVLRMLLEGINSCSRVNVTIKGEIFSRKVYGSALNFGRLDYGLRLLHKLAIIDEYGDFNDLVSASTGVSTLVYPLLVPYGMDGLDVSYVTVMTLLALHYMNLSIPVSQLIPETASFITRGDLENMKYSDSPLEFQEAACMLLKELVSKRGFPTTSMGLILHSTIIEQLRIALHFGSLDTQWMYLNFLHVVPLNFAKDLQAGVNILNFSRDETSESSTTSVKGSSPTRSLSKDRKPEPKVSKPTKKKISFPVFGRLFSEAILDMRCRHILHLWLDVFIEYVPYCILSYDSTIIPVVRHVVDSIAKSGHCLHSYVGQIRNTKYSSTLPIDRYFVSNSKIEGATSGRNMNSTMRSDMNLYTLLNFLSNIYKLVVTAEKDVSSASDVSHRLDTVVKETPHLLKQRGTKFIRDKKLVLLREAKFDQSYRKRLTQLSDEMLNMLPKIIYTACRIYILINPESFSEHSSNLENSSKSGKKSVESNTMGAIDTRLIKTGTPFYFAEDVEYITASFLSELRSIAVYDVVASFADTLLKENNGITRSKDKTPKLVVFNLMGHISNFPPAKIIEDSISILKQRSPIPGPKDRRITAILTRVSDSSMLFFLESYCKSIADEFSLVSTYSHWAAYVKDSLSHIQLYKHHFVPFARVLTLYLLKLDNVAIFEERKQRKEAEDLFSKVLDTILLTCTRVFETGLLVSSTSNSNLSAIASDYNELLNSPREGHSSELAPASSLTRRFTEAELAGAMSSLREPDSRSLWINYDRKTLTTSAEQVDALSDTALIQETIQYIVSMLPILDKLISDTDKRAAIVTNIVYYLNVPLLKMKTTTFEDQLMNLLAVIAEYPHKCKSWKTLCWDIFNDPTFLKRSIDSLQVSKKFVAKLLESDMDRFKTENITRISSTITSTIFGNKEAEVTSKCYLIRKLSFGIITGEIDQFVDDLPTVQEKLVDVLKGQFNKMHAEAYNCIRALLVKVHHSHLSNIWPTVINVLIQLLSINEPWKLHDNDPQMYDIFATGCKLLDLIFTLRPPDFQWHQWIFIEENKDFFSTSISHMALIDGNREGWVSHASPAVDSITVAVSRRDTSESAGRRRGSSTTSSKFPYDVDSNSNVHTDKHPPLAPPINLASAQGVSESSLLSATSDVVADVKSVLSVKDHSESTVESDEVNENRDKSYLQLTDIGVPTYEHLRDFMLTISKHTFENICTKETPDLLKITAFVEKDIFSYPL